MPVIKTLMFWRKDSSNNAFVSLSEKELEAHRQAGITLAIQMAKGLQQVNKTGKRPVVY